MSVYLFGSDRFAQYGPAFDDNDGGGYDSGGHESGGADMGSEEAQFERIQQAAADIRSQVQRVIVGQEDVLDQLLMSLFASGHCLLVGVPGLAKTLMISSLAQTMALSFSRIQFTPDLMPSDITGTEVIQDDPETGERRFQFLSGPIFANVILADEINRTPPKTQAALLEAMQERQVTVGGTRHTLTRPFFVLATQNPIEQEGTYPLPEAQLDRFMFNIQVGYPTEQEELEIMQRTTSGADLDLSSVISGEEIIQLQQLVRRVPVADEVIRYAIGLTRATRVSTSDAPGFVREHISWGAGPRAGQYLILGGKARAILDGRSHVTFDDIRRVAHPVLRHRILTNFAAEAEGVTSDTIISRLLEEVPAHVG